MFYEYNQNNSGGVFLDDLESGISHWVIVEADNSYEADEIAQSIGLYFNGCELGRDCDCCGDRWYPAYGGSERPEVYGRAIEDGKIAERDEQGYFRDIKWMNGPEGFIHYKDGRVEAFDY